MVAIHVLVLCIASALALNSRAEQMPLGRAGRIEETTDDATAPPTVIHLVADDLGYHDTNWKNHQVSTDALDALVKVGIEIPDFYVYKMCAPSRGSVLTGRYPWHVGYYANNGGGGPPLGFKLLPELLSPTYDSHMLGKVSHCRYHCGHYGRCSPRTDTPTSPSAWCSSSGTSDGFSANIPRVGVDSKPFMARQAIQTTTGTT